MITLPLYIAVDSRFIEGAKMILIENRIPFTEHNLEIENCPPSAVIKIEDCPYGTAAALGMYFLSQGARPNIDVVEVTEFIKKNQTTPAK